MALFALKSEEDSATVKFREKRVIHLVTTTIHGERWGSAFPHKVDVLFVCEIITYTLVRGLIQIGGVELEDPQIDRRENF